MGSLVAAVGSWLFARSRGGSWLVRIEDLDPPREVAGSADEILSALERYGLHWDGEVVRQSTRTHAYAAALERLGDAGLVFDCSCSRADLQRAASAPSSRDPAERTEVVYPGTCRNGLAPGREARATRFKAPDEVVPFDDAVLGRIEENVARETGDFVVRRADGIHAYQLAVVVDDIAQGVSQVVRGGDLLSSTARQIALIRALGGDPPEYAHLPLVEDGTGEKLSKRNGALPLPSLTEREVARSLRNALEILGVERTELDTPERMLGEALARFEPSRVPKGSVVLSVRAILGL
jgi:glutamyl-Q tRNA(Asp) synthetase